MRERERNRRTSRVSEREQGSLHAAFLRVKSKVNRGGGPFSDARFALASFFSCLLGADRSAGRFCYRVAIDVPSNENHPPSSS